MASRDDQLISIYLKFFFFIKIIIAYCFFNVLYLRDSTFSALEAESIIDALVIYVVFEYEK